MTPSTRPAPWLRSLALPALAAALLLAGCGGDAEERGMPEVSAQPDLEDAEMTLEDMAEDLAVRLDSVLGSTEDELARLEELLPELAMDARMRLAGEVEALSSQLAQLRDLEREWTAAGPDERQALEDRIRGLLDEVDMTLERTDDLLYAQGKE